VSVRVHSAWLLAIGALVVFALHRQFLGSLICGLGLFLLIAGQLYPPLARAIDNLSKKASSLAGSALSWILLAPFYLIFFSLGHALLVMRGRDPLHLSSSAGESTYWLPVSPEPSREDYRSQY